MRTYFGMALLAKVKEVTWTSFDFGNIVVQTKADLTVINSGMQWEAFAGYITCVAHVGHLGITS